jgi:hypothetical protein
MVGWCTSIQVAELVVVVVVEHSNADTTIMEQAVSISNPIRTHGATVNINDEEIVSILRSS